MDDVWLWLGEERRLDVIGDGEALDTERGGITLRLATVGTGDVGNSVIDDVDVVIDDVGCVRDGIDGGITLVLGGLPFFAGVGMIVGRRIALPVDFSELDNGGEGSLLGAGTWRGFDGGLETISFTSASGDETSEYSRWNSFSKQIPPYCSSSLSLVDQFHFVIV